MPPHLRDVSTTISQRYREEIEGYYGILIAIVLISILFYSIVLTLQKSIMLGATVSAISMATILAWTMIGGFLGFLFGIPKLLQRAANLPPQPPGAEGQANSSINKFLNSNSNLEEISDWVTKIIVGLGLTQIASLPSYVRQYGQQFSVIDDTQEYLPIYFVLLTIFATFSGFLLAYIETRTRIASLLLSTESELTNGPSSKQLQLAAKADQFPKDEELSRTARVRFERAIGATPTPGDTEILKAPITSFTDAEGLAARASAHARAGELQAAESIWLRVLAYYPSSLKLDYYMRLAEVRTALDKVKEAVNTLLEARRSFGDDPLLLRRIVFLSLYLEQPLGFRTAIEAGDAAAKLPDAGRDPMLLVWRAAANGQMAAWSTNKVEDSETHKVRDSETYKVARKAVIELARQLNALVPDRNERPRVFMRQMLDPLGQGGPPEDSDLSIFRDDEEVRSIIME